MAYNQKSILTDANSKPIPQEYDQANDVFVPLLKMKYYGLSTDSKPLSTNTPVGATFTEVDTKNVYMNNGTNWVSMGTYTP